MQRAVEVFAIIHLTTMGLSHIIAHRAWARFFVLLREKGDPGVFVVAFMSLGFGSIIAAFHPVWTGLSLVLTLLAWGQVIKGLVYFIFPSFGLRRLSVITLDRSKLFVPAGVGLLALAGVIAANAWFR